MLHLVAPHPAAPLQDRERKFLSDLYPTHPTGISSFSFFFFTPDFKNLATGCVNMSQGPGIHLHSPENGEHETAGCFMTIYSPVGGPAPFSAIPRLLEMSFIHIIPWVSGKTYPEIWISSAYRKKVCPNGQFLDKASQSVAHRT